VDEECFKREGIDNMLANHEIEKFFISHSHFDHFWGLPVTYKYDPPFRHTYQKDSILKINSILLTADSGEN
jgi:7,8-dihydropterin-6-yl-methyl-4-(beta-D-ribofuranosyl)aminobenzene 5'-phosphate synthase